MERIIGRNNIIGSIPKNRGLEPLNSRIQVCPNCGKVDAYKNDGHNCFQHIQNQEAQEYYD